MELRPRQQLLLHGVLLHYLTLDNVDRHVKDEIRDLMEEIEDNLLFENAGAARPADPDEEVQSVSFEDSKRNQSQDQETYSTGFIMSTLNVCELPSVRGKQPDGTSGRMTFFEENDQIRQLCLEFISTNGQVEIFSDVTVVTRKGSSLELVNLYGDEYTFYVTKFPKEWTTLLEINRSYEIR
jgi:nucleoid-associated protein YgaU